MAESKKAGWKKVTKNYQVKGGARRKAAAVIVSEHGQTDANVEATRVADRTAIARGIDPSREYLVDSLVDEERGLIAIYATDTATPGTSTIRRYKKGATSKIAFHLGAAFAEAPGLRPTIKSTRCLVAEEVDENGLPIMVIAIKAGVAHNTQSRPAQGNQAAASEN